VSKAAKRERQRQNREARREYEEQVAKRRRRMRSARNFAFVLTPFVIIFAVIAITNSGGSDSNSSSAKTQYATLKTSMGDIVVQLSSKEAPKSEAQFVSLAKKGFYNGLKFHRVSSSTGIIQSGDPNGDGTGGSGNKLKDELPKTPYQIGDFAFANSGRTRATRSSSS
jgi:hypothetical protein